MKKIILFLSLFVGINLNAQIVGGWMPVNSTKSFTAGNSTFSNVIARGTASVAGSATVSGNAVFSGSVLSTGNFSCNGIVDGTTAVRGAYLQANGANGFVLGGAISGVNRIDNNSGTFRFLGSANTVTNIAVNTVSLGSANLTGGNTGTVAVLSDVTVPYYFVSNTSLSPNDGDVRYAGVLMPAYAGLATATAAIGFYVNDNIEVVRYDLTVWNNATAGSAESITVSLVSGSSSTLGLLNNTVTSNSQAQFTGTTSINVNSGTRMLLEWKFPTYVTNPTGVWFCGIIYTRRRS